MSKVNELVEQEVQDDQEISSLENEGEESEDDLENEENEMAENRVAKDEAVFGVWDDKVTVKRLKVLLYGISGTGKTTMAATFPRPLFLDLEGGMLSVRKYKPLRYPANTNKDIKTYSEVIDFYQLVKNFSPDKAPFDTIVIDSLNELQVLIAQHVREKYTGVKRQYGDQLTLADYLKANTMFMQVTRLFQKLPYHIVFTAISTQKESGEDSDVIIAPKFIGRQVGPDIQRMMDLVGYCHAKRLADGSSQHYVGFRITPQYLAKDRLGIVSRDIPNSFEALIDSAKGEK